MPVGSLSGLDVIYFSLFIFLQASFTVRLLLKLTFNKFLTLEFN